MPGSTPFDDDGVPHPDRIGRYVLLLPIAAGGMGTVYLARTRGLGGFERDVALKLSHPHLKTPEFTIALLDEAVLAGGIRHPHVVSVLDVGEDPNGLFVVMEYVEGDSLAGLARRARHAGTPLPTDIVLRLVDDALIGLHAAHELTDADGRNVGLVHRDFSPQNVLVGIDGMAKLTDFGVAKALGRLSHTQSGAIKGKVSYMAPEQARGEPLDRRADVWAAGVVTWELLAGRHMYKGVPDAVTLLKIVSERPPRIRFVRPDIAPELDDVVAKALEPNLDARFQDADSFARELARAARSSVGLAERRDVASFVSKLLESVISARRAKVKKIVELKEQMGLLTRLPTTRRSPSLADATPSSESLRPAYLPTHAESTPEELVQTDSIGVASTHRLRAASVTPARVPRIALAVSVLLSLAMIAVVLVLSIPKAGPPLRHVGWQPLPTLTESPKPSGPEQRPESVQLRVHADALVAEVLVGGKSHRVEPPKKTFTLEVERMPGSAIELEAVSKDGVRTKLEVAADSNLAEISFPTTSKGGAPARPTLLPSPYGH